jgi:hypothetical protein
MLQTWNPKSKNEPHATSAAELIKIAKEAVDDFFEIPVGITDDLINDLAEGFENLFKDYSNLVTACGKKVAPSLFFVVSVKEDLYYSLKVFSWVFSAWTCYFRSNFLCGSNCLEAIWYYKITH